MNSLIQFTANDTFPTTITFNDSEEVSGVVNITGYTIALEIAYQPTLLVKTATLTDPTNGTCELQWADGELKKGTYRGRLTITNAAGKKISSEMMIVEIEEDLT